MFFVFVLVQHFQDIGNASHWQYIQNALFYDLQVITLLCLFLDCCMLIVDYPDSYQGILSVIQLNDIQMLPSVRLLYLLPYKLQLKVLVSH